MTAVTDYMENLSCLQMAFTCDNPSGFIGIEGRGEMEGEGEEECEEQEGSGASIGVKGAL